MAKTDDTTYDAYPLVEKAEKLSEILDKIYKLQDRNGFWWHYAAGLKAEGEALGVLEIIRKAGPSGIARSKLGRDTRRLLRSEQRRQEILRELIALNKISVEIVRGRGRPATLIRIREG